jgi:cyanophycinase
MRTPTIRWSFSLLAAVALGCSVSLAPTPAPKVGSAKGSVMVVGGGGMGPELYQKFIELAGGPNGLIVVVPTSGGTGARYDSATSSSVRSFKNYGAKNVAYLHSFDRKLTDTDSFVAVLKKATGVWFDGGRQWNLSDAYGGTKTETEFMAVYQRGGVVGGSSAGASILGSYMVRGARSGNTVIMDPTYGDKGFGYLRGVGIDQHVVARNRLADLSDSLIPRRPELLGISEDEGTAWVVRGDKAVIMGRNKAFAYNGKEKDPTSPFLTLHPGDTYDLAKREVIKRAIDATPLTMKYVDELFATLPASSKATILVAQDGNVLVDKGYGIPPNTAANAKYIATTTIPQFPLGALALAHHAIVAQLAVNQGRAKLDDPLVDGGSLTLRQYFDRPADFAANSKAFADFINRKTGTAFPASVRSNVWGRTGITNKTTAAADGLIQSNVDELFRFDLGLSVPSVISRDSTGAAATGGTSRGIDPTFGWTADKYKGVNRYTLLGGSAGAGNVYVRIPDRKLSIIMLTNTNDAAVKAIAEKITDKLVK